MSASLDETWFIEDSLGSMEVMPEVERASFETKLRWIDPDNREALHKIYDMSRVIKTRAIMAGKFDDARKMTHWESLNVLETICELVGMGIDQYKRQQPDWAS